MLFSSSRGGICCEKLCWTHEKLVDFSSSKYAEFRVRELLGNTHQNGVRIQSFQGLDRQAERTETLTLASCVLLPALLLLLPLCCWRSSAVDVIQQQ